MTQENATKTLQEKITILSKDFLDRDGETFTYEKKDGRLNWESRVSEGGSYSEFVLHPKSDEELITNAYKIATDMITVMDAPFKVKVNITGNQSCTDSKELFVATKVFDDKDMSVGQKLDTFIGFAVHEGCHLLYTNFNTKLIDRLTATLQNIIEDERIERKLGDNKPGLVNFLKAAKYYSFDKYRKDILAQGGFDKLGLCAKIVNAVLAYIRYPKALSAEDITNFADILLKAREALTPYPTDSVEAGVAAQKIRDAIKDFLKDNAEQQKQQKQQKNNSNQSSGTDQNTGESETNSQNPNQSDSEDNTSENGSSSENPANENQQKQNSQQTENSSPQQSESKSKSKPKSKSKSKSESNSSGNSAGSEQNSEEKAEQEIENTMSQLSDALKQVATEQAQDIDTMNMANAVLQEGGRVGEVCSGNLERGKLNGTYVHKAIDNRSVYDESLRRIKPHIPAISKVLRLSSTDYKLSLRGCRSGVLDTGKLAEAFQGVPTVYMREGEVKTDRCSVCILIDESGSMYGTGESRARDTAILLNEAIKKIPNVDLYIYGHTATRKNVDLFVYREKNIENKFSLGATESRSGNRDSIAIKEACSRVRKHTKDRCLFFMISDGAPNEGVDEVRKAVKAVEKDNFSVVAISIDPYYDPSTMYSKNVTLKNMSTLAVEVGKLVKKAVLENTKKQISM